jgi:hypothetical protein
MGLLKTLRSVCRKFAIGLLSILFSHALYAQSHPYEAEYNYSNHKLESLANHGDADAAFYLGLRLLSTRDVVVGFLSFQEQNIACRAGESETLVAQSG